MKYDVIIAGAGIIGLATGLKILEGSPDTRLLILEKENQIALHQTGRNSGVIHSGIYYKPGSLKAKNCLRGYQLLIDFCNRENIHFEICGKLIIATDEKQLPLLNQLYERGIANGLHKITKIPGSKIFVIEPYAKGIEGIFVPYTGITDYKIIAKRYADLIVSSSGEIKLNEKLKLIRERSDEVEIITENNIFRSKVFINCAGLFSDRITRLIHPEIDIRIIPFRGEYFKLKKDKRHLVKHLIYPVPDPEFPFLGVHFTRMIDGEVEAGPNAVLSFKREGYKKYDFNIKDTFDIIAWKGFRKLAVKYFKIGLGEVYRSLNKKAFTKELKKLIPEIRQEYLTEGEAGVRAQAVKINGELVDDFLIDTKNRIINILNAPSPAATSSLAIGETVSELAFKFIN